MTRREFYLIVAESGVTPATLHSYLSGLAKPQRAKADAIESAASKLGIELDRADKSVGEAS